MSRTSETGIVEGLGQLVTHWDPATDQHFVTIESVRKILNEKSWCYVHDVPPVSDIESMVIDKGEIDNICIQVVRVS